MSPLGTPPPSSEITPEPLYVRRREFSEPAGYGAMLTMLLAIRLVSFLRARAAR